MSIAQYIWLFTVSMLGLSLRANRIIMERLHLLPAADSDDARLEEGRVSEDEVVNPGFTEVHDIQDQSAGGQRERQDTDTVQNQAESGGPCIYQGGRENTGLAGRYNPQDVFKARASLLGQQYDVQAEVVDSGVREACCAPDETANPGLGVPDDSPAQVVDSRLPIMPGPLVGAESVLLCPAHVHGSAVFEASHTFPMEASNSAVGALECRCAYLNPSAPSPIDKIVFKTFQSLKRRHEEWKTWYIARKSDTSPKIVIYSDEDLRENAIVDVSFQVMHTTTKLVISSSLASESCEGLGVDGLLSHFNELLDTSYSVETPGLREVLEQCIEHHYDFGTAFARLRSFWVNSFEAEQGYPQTWKRIPRLALTDLIQLLEGREQKDKEVRTDAVDREKKVIKNRNIAPRRVWDLFANRVVPTYAVHESHLTHVNPSMTAPIPRSTIWPVSHSWMADERRRDVDTPINGHEWFVPLPDDTTLDQIRIELLNLGAEYVWLDVLCLRQEDSQKPENEELRKMEWELDVPMIGKIYNWDNNIVTYLNGLGRLFEIGDITDTRHWLNRAWTLQEGSMNTLIGGQSAHSTSSVAHSNILGEPPLDARQLNKFCVAMHTGDRSCRGLFPVLKAMLDRTATYEIDKVIGLTHILCQSGCRSLPMYLRGKHDPDILEQAWAVIVAGMKSPLHPELAFLYPVPGDSGITWRPSWSQLTSGKSRPGNGSPVVFVAAVAP
ncbi:hypothetical protein NM688_g4099 [Phlebia brevispora]|uniref:Uncharacterized protein n=1 Tax=Phlebia brevispora TaxID=194682 RepID=A0ACC1T3W2_9APHY|nr:hypothetical protein NM688_g4099 [Phlebia brevispora]